MEAEAQQERRKKEDEETVCFFDCRAAEADGEKTNSSKPAKRWAKVPVARDLIKGSIIYDDACRC